MKLFVRPVLGTKVNGSGQSMEITGDEAGLLALRNKIDELLSRDFSAEHPDYDQGSHIYVDYPGAPNTGCVVRIMHPTTWDDIVGKGPPVYRRPERSDD